MAVDFIQEKTEPFSFKTIHVYVKLVANESICCNIKI